MRNFSKLSQKKEICDSSKDTEAIIAIAVGSREEVDSMVEKAVKAGGNEPRPVQDNGWMYGRSFEDINGHLWEVFYMDENAMSK